MTQMNQSSVLSADQLLQRSNKLDAREAYLATREKFAESQEEDIAEAERQLVILGVTVEQKEKLIAAQVKRTKDLDADYDARLKAYTAATNGFPAKIEAWQDKVKSARQNLAAVDEIIAGRETYQKDQEALIADQAESGNTTLRGLDYEITEATQVIKDLKAAKRLLIQDKQQLETDLEQARTDFQVEIHVHQVKLAHIESQIIEAGKGLTLVIDKKNEAYKDLNTFITKKQIVSDEIDAKALILDTKEREIMAKREALRIEREEMEEAKHYYTSPKSLYDV